MMNSTMKNTFSGVTSGISRAGVVVGYTPEDTMKSFLFNQNNKHCINLDEDYLSILKLPQNDIERALDFLSSDSESESSSMTKITVKNASSLTENSYGGGDKSHGNQNSKSNADLEIWNGVENSDGDCTSADISNEFGDVQSEGQLDEETTASAGSNKLFQQILEENLRKEVNAPTKPQRGQCKSDPGSKPKFSFLRKNAGRAAWCSNVRPDRSSFDRKSKMRSQSNDRETVRQPLECNTNSHLQQHQPVKRVKSMASTLKKSDTINKTEKPLKSTQKTVHFAATHRSDSELDLHPAVEPMTMVNQKVAEIEDRSLMVLNESQDLDKDLVEFELLEQIANVSINSSIASSIAMYDEENLREKLRKYRNMPPPTSYTQNKYCDFQSSHQPELVKVSTKPERSNKTLSTCEEQSENTQITTSGDTDIDGDSDEESQDISNNTTTLSEFQEPMMNNSMNLPFEIQKSQAFTRKISKQNERHKPFEQENQEWIDENPFQLENINDDTTKCSSQKTTLKLPRVDWTFADPFHQSGSSSDDENDDNALNRGISQLKENLPTFPIYPNVIVNKHQSNPDDNINVQSAKLKQWVQLLESEVKRFKTENEEIERLKKEKEEGLKRLEDEMKIFKKHKEDETKKFEEYKQSEMKKLKKERKVFEDYQEAMKSMPNKKDRQEIENLKSEVDILKEEASNKESRWQAANTRLKQKVDQLETENAELHSRIHSLEQKRLQLQAQLVSNRNQKPKIETTSSKPKQTVTSVSQAVSMKHSNIPIGPLSKEDNNSNKCIAGNTKIPNQMKKNAPKATNNNSNRPQKPVKTSVNPLSPDNGIMDIRGSAASDYYTGEEESGSIDLKTNKMNIHSVTYQNNTDFAITPIAPNVPYAVKIDRANEVIKDELNHPDGILERIYMNGSIDVVYPNGSLKQISADSKSVIVHLYNGDVKQITPDGRVIYFYAQDESSQTTYPNGKEEIVYKNGHKEVVHPSGIREINFPDKSIKILHPDSREETFLPNGLVIRVNGSGDKEILLPNGQKEIHTSGIKKRIYPDGTTKTVYPDGRQETFYASGRMRVKDRNGNLILDQYITKTNSLTSSD